MLDYSVDVLTHIFGNLPLSESIFFWDCYLCLCMPLKDFHACMTSCLFEFWESLLNSFWMTFQYLFTLLLLISAHSTETLMQALHCLTWWSEYIWVYYDEMHGVLSEYLCWINPHTVSRPTLSLFPCYNLKDFMLLNLKCIFLLFSPNELFDWYF